jgi:hypothetical protein
MLEELPSWVGDTAAPWSLLGLVILLIITGRLIPQFYYKELKEDRDRWRASSETKSKAIAVFAEAFPEILEVGKTTEKIMTSAPVQEETK